MLQTGYLKLVTEEDQIFQGTKPDDFTVSSTSDLHIGSIAGEEPATSAMVLGSDGLRVLKPASFAQASTFNEILTNAVTADRDQDVKISTSTHGRLKIDDVTFKGGSTSTPLLASDRATIHDAYANMVHVGTDSRLTLTAFDAGVMKLAGFVLPTAPVLPDPVDELQPDPVELQRDRDRYASELAVARSEADALTAASPGADVSLDVSKIVVKSVTHPPSVTHTTHVGNAEFKDYVRVENVLTIGDASNTQSGIRHSADELAIDTLSGEPGFLELRQVAFHESGSGRVAASHGGAVGAWDVLDVVQLSDVSPVAPGFMRGRGYIFGSTSSSAGQDHAIVAGAAGLSAVRSDNGSFAAFAPFNAGALQLHTGLDVATIRVDSSRRLASDTVVSMPGWDCVDANDIASSVKARVAFGRLQVDAVMQSAGLRVGGVDLSPAQSNDPGAGVTLSQRLTLPTVRIGTADRYHDISANPTTGAFKLQGSDGASATFHPSTTSLDVSPSRLRLVDTATDTYTELQGGEAKLGLSVDTIEFPAGAAICIDGAAESAKIRGCTKLVLDTCVFDAQTVPDTVTVSTPSLGIGGGDGVVLTAEDDRHLLIGPRASMVVRASDVMTLQARLAVTLRLNEGLGGGGGWKEYAFSSRSDGALLINGHDVDIIPKDALDGVRESAGVVDGEGWWRTVAPVIHTRFAHGATSTGYPRIGDIIFNNSVAQTVEGQYSTVTTNGFKGLGVDVQLASPAVLRRVHLPRVQVTQNDRRPTNWRVYGTDGKANASSVWEELGRAGFADFIDVYTRVAYDGYRVVIGSISGGTSLENTGLQLLTLPGAQEVQPQHSFTGSHLVAPNELEAADALEPGMLVTVARDGYLDSIARGGWKGRGGASAIRIDSALPFVRKTTSARDRGVFGVFAGAVHNRWYSRGVDVRWQVQGLGEGAVWVCDQNGPLTLGDLLCSSDVPGYAMRQDDDLVRSYTVGKCTMSCDFEPVDRAKHELVPNDDGDVGWTVDTSHTEPGFETRVHAASGARCAFISCVYMCS